MCIRDRIIARLRAAHEHGLDVARVHTGDPALYGAIGEQIRELDRLGIPYQAVSYTHLDVYKRQLKG